MLFAGQCRGESPCNFFLRDFFLSCQKETPQTPKKRRFGAYRRLNPVFTKLCGVERLPSLMVNGFSASPTVRLLRFARGTDGKMDEVLAAKRRSASTRSVAATNGSNARFWWLTSFTSRDDHVAELLSRRKAARYASRRSLAFFFGASLPFLWARPKKWGDKDNAGAFAPAIVL